ncbi:MAG TPA: ATP-dependent protease subunit HslV [Mesotoga sp.]|jgi:ATP-dependent HslUV protease subunit HslV|uniref:ATP-dependent protease subunit HslV n=1 Tax=unclassified Mesotoga TaxID=1184398 RepID=UPI000B33514D|nr:MULTISPECIES: ATP-dependent protease subunit HslV [unclassified Mesotoga]PNQ06123.1 peptidase [Mesotoga sp. SC_NapDC3]PXF35407.1 peptidase [Mesotoga sp. SC_NapDC]RAM63345.1 peptidase [Mesotoga sp. SC_3PWM13N19]RIZ61665.1 peptidase [Mesotoga sp. SC_NapDC2]MDD3459820.1 ATP-dependent protease subunit HslV [Mesotoga sp.]
MKTMHGTTVLVLRRNGNTVMVGDGQITIGDTVMKGTARKVRKLGDGAVLAGFAGSVADAMTLFEKFEEKLKEVNSNLKRAAVNLAKEWRTNKILKNLQALLLVADKESILLVSGNGEVIEPDEEVLAIGSGGSYALAAARALMRNSDLNAEEIARRSMTIASEICIYTNTNFTLETLGGDK